MLQKINSVTKGSIYLKVKLIQKYFKYYLWDQYFENIFVINVFQDKYCENLYMYFDVFSKKHLKRSIQTKHFNVASCFSYHRCLGSNNNDTKVPISGTLILTRYYLLDIY